MKEKFVPQDDKALISRRKDSGPIFGNSAPDIWIKDECDKKKAISEFPSCYNRKGENKLKIGKKTNQLFSGASGHEFKVAEYEVFKVVYK